MLVEESPHELAVGATSARCGAPRSLFVHVANADAYTAFIRKGWIKVAWALRIVLHGATHASSSRFVSARPTTERGGSSVATSG
jgi:hypothetical protein